MIHPDVPVLSHTGVYERLGTVGWEGKAVGASGWRLRPTSVEEFRTQAGSETVELQTESGNRLTCSPDQMVSIVANVRKTWRKARSVTLGQLLVCESGGVVINDRVVAVTRNETQRPLFFVSLRTGTGNAFFGGVLCACR